MPEGYEIQIRDKPGNALKKGLLVAGAPMTIDARHQGEMSVCLVNNTPFLCKVTLGDVIAQGVAGRIQHIVWEKEISGNTKEDEDVTFKFEDKN
jgi:dUTPase